MRFLDNPKVVFLPTEAKRQFLLSKGLSQEQVQAAVAAHAAAKQVFASQGQTAGTRLFHVTRRHTLLLGLSCPECLVLLFPLSHTFLVPVHVLSSVGLDMARAGRLACIHRNWNLHALQVPQGVNDFLRSFWSLVHGLCGVAVASFRRTPCLLTPCWVMTLLCAFSSIIQRHPFFASLA